MAESSPDLQLLEAISVAGAEANERFNAEMRELDWAWKTGDMDAWLKKQYENAKREAVIG